MKNNNKPGWAGVLRKGLLAVLLVGGAAALIEHILESRDAARLSASETFFTDAEGRRVRYHQTGMGNAGPTVVLINGIAGSLEQWDKVQSALSTTSPVLSYDRAGAGFNDFPAGYDGYASTAELERLLRAPGIAKPPYVVVSFSSSAMMAIVFAATHLDVVKGIVFIDPILGVRDSRIKTYRRIFLRTTVVSPIEALFGYTRLKYAHMAHDTPQAERWEAIVKNTHHWIAGSRDALSMDATAAQADALMASRPFAHLPLGELITDPPDGGFGGVQKELVARSDRGILRSVRDGHSELLEDPAAIAALVDLIHTVGGSQGNGAGELK
jgi:pimeloyl-ACP methyl ester carboxylesterase